MTKRIRINYAINRKVGRKIEHANGRMCIASDQEGWEHVSVSLRARCPTWDEMCFIKDVFWDDEETVVQFHPPKSEYVNHHKFCLHLWKQIDMAVVTPPSIFVGPR